MNCLNSRNRRELSLSLQEPSAPPYYPTQPPYNPEYEYYECQFSDEPRYEYEWSVVDSEYVDAETAYEGDDESGWGRRSLYEGVNCSAPSQLHSLSRSIIRSLMSDREFLTEPLDEEERAAGDYVHPAERSYMYSPMGGDSDSPGEATVKCVAWPEGVIPTRASSSDQSSSSSDESDRPEADYHTLTPSRRLDDSTRRDDDFTRRDDDFQWMPTGEIVDDDVNDNQPNSMETRAEDYPSASLDRRRRTPSDRSDRDRKTRSSLSSKPPQHPTVRASPRPRRHRHEPEEASPELQRRWNSYEHFRWPEGASGGGGAPAPWWPPVCWCHGPPPPPPCCMHDRSWPSHPSLTPIPTRNCQNDAEERVRRLEADKESLQLQVQVLSEQISAQNGKILDLERDLLDAQKKLDDAEQRLQKEMLQRSSLETQKLELLSKLSEFRLRAVERNVLERSPPPDIPLGIGSLSNMGYTSTPVARPQPPRTPPANYGRQIERNNLFYSSLPRSSIVTSEARIAFGKHSMVVARGRGQSVPNLAEKEEAARHSPSPSLRSRLGSNGIKTDGDEFARSSLRTSSHTSSPRQILPWQKTDVRQWDSETTCGWLESLGLEMYVPAARTWLESSLEAKGVIAAASHHTIEKELAIKHPMHKKKIVLALTDLLGGHGDALLTAAGALDTAWVLRWLEDIGLCGARTAASEASLDGRCLHRLSHSELHTHLRVTFALHALSVRRGIQVLRDNKFNPETMIRRAADGEGSLNASEAELARWSSHRVMQWLKEIDLAEYAPNLRGAGVHGGVMLLEQRFTAELLAALLNIPTTKTLLRRHLTQRFNDLLGRDVIQQKRTAEQTLGYQALTAATKYKAPKRGQFSLKRKKSKDDLYLGDLVCPLHDDGSGEIPTSPTMKIKSLDVGSGVCPPRDDARAH